MKVPNLEKAEDGAAMLRHATWGAVASWSQNIHISCYFDFNLRRSFEELEDEDGS